MEMNIILAGVGGQGILSIAYLIDNAALVQGYQFKQAEVHGMAQRGGAVQSHLRIADQAIHSDLVPEGAADMILSVEPVEALRYCHYLKPKGMVITSTVPFVNIPDYPDVEKVFAELEAFPDAMLINSERLAKAAGSARAQNTVMTGAAAPYLPIEPRHLETFLRELFQAKGDKIVDMNLRAFKLGYDFGLFYHECRSRGVPPRILRLFLDKVDPFSLTPAAAAQWAPVLSQSCGTMLLELLAEVPDTISATPETAAAVAQCGGDPANIKQALLPA